MFKKRMNPMWIVLVLGLLLSPAHADLVGYWQFNEAAGGTASDKSGNGNDGALIGGPEWIAGIIGSGALSFDGTDDLVEISHDPVFDLGESITVSAWINLNDIATYYFIVVKGASGSAPDNYPGNFEFRTTPSGQLQLGHQTAENTDHVFYTSDSTVALGQWLHVAATLVEGGPVEFYIDGQAAGSATQSGEFGILNGEPIRIGGRKDSYSFFNGAIDDVQIYNHALTVEEIQAVMTGVTLEMAAVDSPKDEAVDVLRDVLLEWIPGEFAMKHDVYFGTVFDDVNNASTGNDLGVLVSQGQTDTAYTPGILEFGQTYYWRVDEVNAAPDNTVFKGEVWSFTAEPFSIPIEMITATASSQQAGMGPENTIGAVGLNELDQHSTEATDMWLSGMGDATPSIQYEFDKPYKLHQLWVWNSNQLIEAFVGLGAKDVQIEYSADGVEWMLLENVPQFTQATGSATYTANTVVDFGGVLAQAVRITINSGYGMLPQYGLSEVRFYAIPTYAREPKPIDGSTTDGADVELAWRAGREAASHEVYLGTDVGNLPLVATTSENTYMASALDYSTTYYWSITEVNEAEDVPTHPGDIWSFTTPDYGTVDDFDQYDDNCNRVFFAWADGLGHSGGEDIDDCDVPPSNGNGGGSIVGNDTAPFAERTIVNAGGSTQSLPFNYDNSFGQSEATLQLNGQDWTASGVQTLAIAFYGTAGNTGTVYVKINNTKVLYDRDPADIARSGWQAWNIDLTGLSGLQNVISLTIGVDGANAAGMLYFDDIRLYPLAGELVTPADPGNIGLVALYTFEGNANDSSGNGHDGAVEGGASFAPGHTGSALNCDGFSAYVSTGKSASALGIDGNKPRTVTCWIFTRAFNNGGLYDVGNRSNGQDFCLRTLGTESQWRVQYWGGAFDIDFTLDATDKWIHITHVYDGSATQIYANGIVVAEGPGTLTTSDSNPWQIGVYGWQNDYFDGMIDELHLYNRALSAEEALFAAGRQEIHRPF